MTILTYVVAFIIFLLVETIVCSSVMAIYIGLRVWLLKDQQANYRFFTQFIGAYSRVIAGGYVAVLSFGWFDKLVPLIIFTVIEVGLMVVLYLAKNQVWDELRTRIKPESLLNQIAINAGALLSGWLRKQYYDNRFREIL